MSATNYLQDLFPFEGQISVVIGATGVLGGALAEGIARAGAHVVVAGRSAERGAAMVETIKSHDAQASFVEVDVTSRESIDALCQSVVKEHGRVDSLVNCFGVNSAKPYFDIEDEEWDHVISTNLKSTHIASQIFGRQMVDAKQGGAILNIGSVTSYRPLSRVFAYSVSKMGVISLTQNLAREWAPHNIRVNALCPGFFPAEQNRKILDEDRITSIMRHTPMDRFGDPSELVGPALLLLSPVAGSFVTGQAFYVDGGFTAMTI